jgi:hypothetical protein
MKKHLQKMLAAAAGLVPDALMTVGAAGLSHGAWLVYPPAGWIVGGGLLLTAGVLGARKKAA